MTSRERAAAAGGRLRVRSATSRVVSGELVGKDKLGRIGRQTVDHDGFDTSCGEVLAETLQVRFQAPHHNRCEVVRPYINAGGEPLGIEDFKKLAKGVGMSVVRRGSQEEPMLEARRQSLNRVCELAVNGVTRSGGRRRMMRLVEDEQRSGSEFAEHVAKPGRVDLV
jgi:hypothetical protein